MGLLGDIWQGTGGNVLQNACYGNKECQEARDLKQETQRLQNETQRKLLEAQDKPKSNVGVIVMVSAMVLIVVVIMVVLILKYKK